MATNESAVGETQASAGGDVDVGTPAPGAREMTWADVWDDLLAAGWKFDKLDDGTVIYVNPSSTNYTREELTKQGRVPAGAVQKGRDFFESLPDLQRYAREELGRSWVTDGSEMSMPAVSRLANKSSKTSRGDGDNAPAAERGAKTPTSAAAPSRKAGTVDVDVVTVPPGKLGLTLEIKENGVEIVGILPTCSISTLVGVGDKILTVDGKTARSFDDFATNQHRSRKLEIARPTSSAGKKKRGEDGSTSDDDTLRPSKRKKGRTSTSPMARAGQLQNSTNAAHSWIGQTWSQLGYNWNLHADAAGGHKPPKRSRSPEKSKSVMKGVSEMTDEERQKLLSELLLYNKNSATLSQTSKGHQVILVPNKKRKAKQVRESNEKFVARYIRENGVMDKLQGGFATYLDISNKESLGLILGYLAKHFPVDYVATLQHSTDLKVKMSQRLPPPDYKAHDGDETEEAVRFNIGYGELLRYYNEHGSLQDIPPKAEVKHVVKWLKELNKTPDSRSQILNPKRMQMIEDLGLSLNVTRRQHTTGNPKQNKAIAAKLVYPQLSMEECLQLGGFEADELHEKPDEKFPWRTVLHINKHQIKAKLKLWDKMKRGCKPSVEKMAEILRSEEQEAYEEVFGEKAALLPEFLAAAEERMKQGNFDPDETTQKRPWKRQEVDEDPMERAENEEELMEPDEVMEYDEEEFESTEVA
mmetsp:Transcript_15808/g.36424  ORF Transcript_15808/g.36424 Transcript_15808/m.36424 type:complete len:698 (-) Transcript_15808:119-2212(-)